MTPDIALAILEEASRRFLGTAQDHKDIERAISALKDVLAEYKSERINPEPKQEYDL